MNKEDVYKLIDIIEDHLCSKYNGNCYECTCGVNDYMGNSLCAISSVNNAFTELLKDGRVVMGTELLSKKEIKEDVRNG